jgi:ABC-type uncharacterized transport system substrate-binding protein
MCLHFTIGVRFTQGDAAELPAAARDLVRLGVDLIVAADTSNAARAAQMATDRIPIIFVGGSDPVESGLVRSFARPGATSRASRISTSSWRRSGSSCFETWSRA